MKSQFDTKPTESVSESEPWNKHPLKKLQDIAAGADHRTRHALREWMENYVCEYSKQHTSSDIEMAEAVEQNYKKDIERRQLMDLGVFAVQASHMKEIVDKKEGYTTTRYTMFTVTDKKKE